ncbi:uncharacterized protein LOC119078344 [Bradysia coprophila]|uniref:uncharacterized protein LOC119078344 n=1 Tax=Bradysia coprophila TaxID=38358 RepID=UPI00187D91D1|nr:uncharacterized protein LOC119078344 [Bradysia coprophila]
MAKDDNKDEDLIQSLWKRLEDRFNQLEKMDDEVMSELCERGVGEAEMDEEYDQIQEYRDKWTDLNRSEGLIRQQEKDQAELASVTSQVSTSLKDKSRYKLPKLKLVEFNGSPREWLTFWSQFKGINDNESMSSEEKFQYLIQATVDGSVARRVVKSFPPTGENYEKAIQHLKSRFGKENVLVEVYVRDLLKLVLKNTNGMSDSYVNWSKHRQ